MNFISLKYFSFLFLTVILYYLFPKKKKWLVLLFTSFFFYYLSSGSMIIFIMLSIISIYFSGRFLQNKNDSLKLKKVDKEKIKKQKKIVLFFTVSFNFILLLFSKYLTFFIQNLNEILDVFSLERLSLVNIVLPIGISYYTLMAVSYIVDVSRDKIKAEFNILKLALYLIFFPQIIEGPISKYSDVAKNYYADHKFKIDNILFGCSLILIGIFKKMVIADRAGIYVDTVFLNNAYGLSMLMAALLYTLQIYAEFSGCMNIVIGSSKLFGIELPSNFKRPFFSKSVQEFWRRWHITLGEWVKEYIFYPLSLSKLNLKIGKFFKNRNLKFLSTFVTITFPLLIVWLYTGFWHGASWKYIFYGMYYYVFIVLGLLIAPSFSKIINILKINIKSKIFILFQIVRTWLIVIFGMLLFRSTSIMSFFSNVRNIFIKGTNSIFDYGLVKFDYILLFIYVIVLIIIGIFEEKGIDVHKKLFSSNIIIKYIVYLIIIISIIVFGIYGEGYNPSDFIYGQF